MSFACTRAIEDGGPVLTVSGEMDVHTAPEFASAALSALDDVPDGSALTIDLSGVIFLDCSGVGALLASRRRAIARGCRINLVQVPPKVERLLRLTGVDSAFVPDQATSALPPSDTPRLRLSS